MPSNHSPTKATGTAIQGGVPAEGGPTYWNALIDEKAAAEFLGLTNRFMQHRRQQDGGPRYIAISSRCIRYRRIDLRAWSEARLRTSTSDPGQEAA